jgi:hypothetical protein
VRLRARTVLAAAQSTLHVITHGGSNGRRTAHARSEADYVSVGTERPVNEPKRWRNAHGRREGRAISEDRITALSCHLRVSQRLVGAAPTSDRLTSVMRRVDFYGLHKARLLRRRYSFSAVTHLHPRRRSISQRMRWPAFCNHRPAPPATNDVVETSGGAHAQGVGFRVRGAPRTGWGC